MSNSYRNGAFALGLVVGGGIALNLFLWLDYRAQQEADYGPEGNNSSEYSQIGELWDRLIGTFVSPSDTLAQWIMAIFTIAATVVLVFTLRSANKTNRAAIVAANAATEANQIMRLEKRPWLKLHLEPIKLTRSDDGKEFKITIKISATNIGASPATKVFNSVHATAWNLFTDDWPQHREFMGHFGDWRRQPGNSATIFPGDTHEVEHRTNVRVTANSERESLFVENRSLDSVNPVVRVFTLYRSQGGNEEFRTDWGLVVLNASGGMIELAPGEAATEFTFMPNPAYMNAT